MKIATKLLIGVVLALSALIYGHAQTQKNSPPEEERWQTIFDGKTLNGWKPSAPGFFTVEDGAITGRASREQTQSPVFIVWEGGTVKDFRLRFRCRLDEMLDRATIHFRAQVGVKEISDSYQADFSVFFEGLKETKQEEYPFGRLAGSGESNQLKDDSDKIETHLGDNLFEWNKVKNWTEYELRAIGGHIVIEIGGKKVSEFIDQRKERRSQAGSIAISLHAFGDLEFQIKDIELKILRSQSEDSETILANNRIATIEAIFKELSSGSAEKALELLKQNPSLVNVQNESKQTPLHVAALNGHKDVVAWLVANGAELNPVAYNGFTPLHLVKTEDAARILIKAGGNLDAMDVGELTPLRRAAGYKNHGVIKAILETGYKMDLISAIYLGDYELIAKLIQEDPKSVNRLANPAQARSMHRTGNWSPLMIAVWR
ncbi:MAG: DUF1080 domain-containing protein, partial [Acidobacteria bacterium]|nr:DUF1080 domain-containing protein [Acidobacteriota bacterium]